jgi:hypothetical protein
MAKNVTPIIDAKMIASVKWTDAKQRDAFFRDLGATPSNAGIWATMTHGAFAYVASCKASGGNTDPDGCFAAYAAGRSLPGGPGALSATSEPAYKTAIVGLVNTASKLPDNYGSDTLRDFIATECGKAPFGSRSKFMDAILTAHPATVGTAEQMKALRPVTDSNMSSKFASVVNQLKLIAEEFGDSINEHGLAEQYRATNSHAKALASASEKAVPLPPKKSNGNKKVKSAASIALLS